MAGADELDGDLRGDGKRQQVGDADELRHTLGSVLLGIDGLDGLLPFAVFFLVELHGILFLDASGVGQHDGAQVARARGAEDFAPESFLIYIRYQAGMVDVRMRQEKEVDLGRVEAQVAVHAVRFQTFALIHATVEQYLGPFLGGEQELAARHLFCST